MGAGVPTSVGTVGGSTGPKGGCEAWREKGYVEESREESAYVIQPG